MGKIANTGIEVQARVEVLRNKNWNWALSVTMQHNRNKIKKISNALNVMNDSLNAKKTVMPPPVYEEGQSTSAVKAVKSGGIDPRREWRSISISKEIRLSCMIIGTSGSMEIRIRMCPERSIPILIGREFH